MTLPRLNHRFEPGYPLQGRLAQLVRAGPLQGQGHWFDPNIFHQVQFHSRSAVDQRTVNPCVGGSIPPCGAKHASIAHLVRAQS